MTMHHALLFVGMAATAATIFAVPGAANATSRRHVDKPGETVGDLNREIASDGGGAPEIDARALGLGVALAAGGIAILSRRRRSSGA